MQEEQKTSSIKPKVINYNSQTFGVSADKFEGKENLNWRFKEVQDFQSKRTQNERKSQPYNRLQKANTQQPKYSAQPTTQLNHGSKETEEVEELIQCYEESLKDRARLSSEIQKLQEQQRNSEFVWETRFQEVSNQLKDVMNKNTELINLLTSKEQKIEELLECLKNFKNSKPDQYQNLKENQEYKKENQDLADKVKTLQIINQEKDKIIQQREDRIVYNEMQIQKLMDQNISYSQKYSQENDYKAQKKPFNSEMLDSKNSYDLQNQNPQGKSERKIQYINFSDHNSSRMISKQISSRNSPKHQKQFSQTITSSFDSKYNFYRASPDFCQVGASQVLKNVKIPYLGDYPKNRSKSPQKIGLEEMRCPLLSGTVQRWEKSLRGEYEPQNSSFQQKTKSTRNSVSPTPNIAMKRADQMSQEIREKMQQKNKNQQ